MKKKRYIILAIVAAVIVAAIFITITKTQRKDGSGNAGNVYVRTFDVGNVTAFTYLVDDTLAIFSLEDDVWVYYGDTSMEVDTDSIEDFLSEMSTITADSVIENVEDNSEYGVDNPTQMFAVVFSDGSSLTYCFGAEDDTGGGCYLQVTDDADDTDNDTVYLVDRSVVTSTLAADPESFAVK